LFWLSCSAPALAADPLNSNNKQAEDAQPAAGPEAAHSDFNIVPVFGGSTDLGFGGGYFAGLARIKKGYDPYLWNIDSSGLVTFKYDKTSGLSVPYQDLYVKLTVPRLFDAPLRLELRPSYTWEQIDYFGMGNASVRAAGIADSYFKYRRGHPQFDVDVRGRIVDHLAGRVGFRYIQNLLHVPSNSKLADDLRTGSPEVKQLIGSTRSHAVVLFKYGLQWDTRDEETSTHKGSFDTLDLKLSPGGTVEFPYRYGEATLNLRAFLPIWEPRVTLATRAVGDYLFGDPPFYELARYDDTFALGGSKGVRGVPAGRYYGKVKVFGSVELRLELVSFHALGKSLTLGVAPFFDGGRLWADSSPRPELDGRGLGLKYGAGGGLFVQSGSAFVIRADVAWSPDATPVSGYFSAGQAF
jgi:outer membrane protein assembly factor BamA